MTKMKSKKMTKSTFAIIIMAIAMVAMLAFGGTYAYFTATTTAESKTATTGIVNVTAGTIAGWTEETVVTGTELATGVSFKNKSSVETYAIFLFSVKIGGEDAEQSVISYTMDNTNTWTDVTIVEGEGEEAVTKVYKVATLSKVDAEKLETGVDVPVCGKITFVGSSNSHDGANGNLMGKTIEVSIQTWAIQTKGVTTEQKAVEEALKISPAVA